jgi:hypothetical protein
MDVVDGHTSMICRLTRDWRLVNSRAASVLPIGELPRPLPDRKRSTQPNRRVVVRFKPVVVVTDAEVVGDVEEVLLVLMGQNGFDLIPQYSSTSTNSRRSAASIYRRLELRRRRTPLKRAVGMAPQRHPLSK